jgi:hypothetical protein
MDGVFGKRRIGGDGLMFVMMLVVAATWLLDRSPEAAKAGTFLESARQAALARTGHETLGDTGDTGTPIANG